MEQEIPELHEHEAPRTKKMLKTLEDEEAIAIDQVRKESLQWEIKIIKQEI